MAFKVFSTSCIKENASVAVMSQFGFKELDAQVGSKGRLLNLQAGTHNSSASCSLWRGFNRTVGKIMCEQALRKATDNI